jgi:transcriptional regulator with XRE-family HTH domain
MSFSDNLKSTILTLKKKDKSKNWSFTSVAEMLGMKYQSLMSYVNGNSSPSIEVLEKLHNLLGLNINYLITGKGQRFVDNDPGRINQSKIENNISHPVKKKVYELIVLAFGSYENFLQSYK